MSPEQRLTVREAVEMIARHGAAPISESALRARIRSRKIGAVRVGGRVYTNPLNLVTAGLLPVEVLSGTVGEIDDAELHAWLNPEEPAAPVGGGLRPRKRALQRTSVPLLVRRLWRRSLDMRLLPRPPAFTSGAATRWRAAGRSQSR